MSDKTTVAVPVTLYVEVANADDSDAMRAEAKVAADEALKWHFKKLEYSHSLEKWQIVEDEVKVPTPSLRRILKLIPLAILLLIGIHLLFLWPIIALYALDHFNLAPQVLKYRAMLSIFPAAWILCVIGFFMWRDGRDDVKNAERMKNILGEK